MSVAASQPTPTSTNSTPPPPTTTTTTTTTSSSSSSVRLHIVPLTPSTASSLLPASLLSTAHTDISYHTLTTFPEHPYAFVTLPTAAAAAALKKRLHGSTFRGVKVRVEDARPCRPAQMPDQEMEDAAGRMKKEELKAQRREKRKREGPDAKVKKRKKGETKDVLPGVQLPEGRKVARGWASGGAETKSAGKKYAGRSSAAAKEKEDAKQECLFKTPVPANKVSSKKDKKDKKDKDKDKEEKKEKQKKDKHHKKEVVVREFKNNTKFPAFLKSTQLSGRAVAAEMASEYVDGVGWVNGRGEVVEVVGRKKRVADVMQMEGGAEVVKVTETIGEKKKKGEAPGVERYKGTVTFGDGDEDMLDVGKVPAAAAASKYVSDSDSDSEMEAEVPEIGTPLKAHKTSTKATSTPTVDATALGELEAESEDLDLPATRKTESTATATAIVSSEPELSSDSDSDAAPSPTTKHSANTSSTNSSASDSDSDPAPSPSPKPTTRPPTPRTPISLPIRTLTKPATPPTLQITIPTQPTSTLPIHPLEALYKPTATLTLSPGSSGSPGGFKFGFGTTSDSDSDADADAAPATTTPRRERYRSAAPTPDTAIGHRRFFPDDTSNPGFVPSTPRAPASGAVADSPLLFPHAESRFLGALSVWSQLPMTMPKAFVADVGIPEEEEGEEEEEGKAKAKGKGKRKREEEGAREEVQGGEKTPAEVWSERFYEKRGEWNRAWKGRRRDVMKGRKKREAAAKGKKSVSA